MPVILIAPEQIAYSPSEIRPDTKAYIGRLEPKIFQKPAGVEFIYTFSKPEGNRVEDLGKRDIYAALRSLKHHNYPHELNDWAEKTVFAVDDVKELREKYPYK